LDTILEMLECEGPPVGGMSNVIMNANLDADVVGYNAIETSEPPCWRESPMRWMWAIHVVGYNKCGSKK
jgi:hypothetical protein